MLVLGLLRGERAATGLRMEAHELARLLLGTEALVHQSVPDTPSGTKLGDLLEEVVVRVPEEAQARCEGIDRHARGDRRVHVGDAVGNREGDLLHGGAARFADVIARDADGVPLGDVLLRSTRRRW